MIRTVNAVLVALIVVQVPHAEGFKGIVWKPILVDAPVLVMSVDEEGRAVCGGPTEETASIILDHLERHHRDSLGLDYIVDSSDTVTLKFHSVPPDVQETIREAMNLWFKKLVVDVPFTLAFYWEDVSRQGGRFAPLGFISGFYDRQEEEGSWECDDKYCVPKTLANQIAGCRLHGEFDPDPEFEIHINSNYPFYLGLDGQPGEDEFDLVSVVLHELGHAFGFATGFHTQSRDNTGTNTFGDRATYYDSFIWSPYAGDLVDLPRPSRELYDILKGDDVFWGRRDSENYHGERLASFDRNGGPVKLSARRQFRDLLNHLDPGAFPASHPDSLMNPSLGRGDSERIGPVTLGMLYDLGWQLKEGPTRCPTRERRLDEAPERGAKTGRTSTGRSRRTARR